MLTPDDAAAVLRRAAELDTPGLDAHDALEEGVVRAAAREVGLSDAAVERAVGEWRAGVLAPLPPLAADRWAGLPADVVVHGLVALPVAATEERLAAWLRGQWFERRRVRGQESDWAPRHGVLASVRRAADLDNRLRLRGIARLRTCVAPAQDGARVRLVADLRDTRTGLLTGLVAAPALLTAAVGAALGLGPDGLLALPLAAGVGGTGWLGARAVLAGRHRAVAEELHCALDELERPEPPPRARRATGWALERLPRQPR